MASLPIFGCQAESGTVTACPAHSPLHSGWSKLSSQVSGEDDQMIINSRMSPVSCCQSGQMEVGTPSKRHHHNVVTSSQLNDTITP